MHEISILGQMNTIWEFKVKFVFFEKATKFDEISILFLTNKFVFFFCRYSFEHQSGSQSWNFT